MTIIEQAQNIAADIFKELGNEQDEVTYKNAFEVACQLDKLKYQRELDLPIYYRDHIVGRGQADFVLYSDITLAIEVKAVSSWGDTIPPTNVSQLKNYMRSLNTKYGLLINFPQAGTSCKKQAVETPEFFVVDLDKFIQEHTGVYTSEGKQ